MIDPEKVVERVSVTASTLGIEKSKREALAEDIKSFLASMESLDTGRSAIHDDAPIPAGLESSDDQPE